MQYAYKALIEPADGRFEVTFPDVPSAITFGATLPKRWRRGPTR